MIFPTALLEKPISEHPDILEVKVVPVPDKDNGENSCACVVKRPESDLSPKDIVALAEDTMSGVAKHYYALDHVIIFENTIVGKTKEELISAACLQLGITKIK
ncbi:4-coumarate--coa ligase-like 4 [Plakobranchus ocellatus]|uniref:4-coumarate--coa ligase-like 4 n=1 Tax=Plakobranchus ocellatus TaxID=259542 RepID=A0AAV4D3M1_9GAST|nr:4-coumarate--coa ligase-like 4 [Plakobranchus ocellatus]